MRPLAVVLAAVTVASGVSSLAVAAPVRPAPSRPLDGAICIAPFHVNERTAGEPHMSQTTWAPSPDSTFRFDVDRKLRATVSSGEMAVVRDLPVDRPVRVRVTLDGKPFETFSLDLGQERDHRVCLWLYPGYWHWIDNGWTEALGCKCPKEAPEGEQPSTTPQASPQ